MQQQMNVQGTANLLGLSIHTIRAYVSRRRIPFRKVGARVLFDPDELQAWMQGMVVAPIEQRVRKVQRAGATDVKPGDSAKART